MSEVKITKQTVKNYLDLENKDLAKEMQERMDRSEEWSDFKTEMAVLIAAFANKPTKENKSKLDTLISSKYINEMAFAREALEQIFRGLGIREEVIDITEKKPLASKTQEAYRRSIYERLGIEYAGDILKEEEERFKQQQDKKYGIVRKNTQKETSSEKKSEPTKKDGKIKKAYYRLTSAMIMAPGEVPQEILEENREMIETASQKLEIVIKELEEARDIASKRNKANIKAIPKDIQEYYRDMSEGKMDEEALEGFEETLLQKQEEQLQLIREQLDYLQASRLKTALKTLVQSKFPDMPAEELEAEIEYVVLDSKIGKDGKLVLPERSVFKEVVLDENGDALPEQTELVASITAYTSAPKASELSDEAIERLAKNIKDFRKKLNPESKEYAVAEFLKTNPDMLPEDSDEIKQEIEDTSREYLVTKVIAKEAQFRHKLMISEEIKEQFAKIKEIVRRYDEKENTDGELSKADAKRRETVLKIARKKVASLDKAGLSRIITEGEKKSTGVMKRAKSILLPHLEDARDKGTKRLDKEFKRSEPEEPGEEK